MFFGGKQLGQVFADDRIVVAIQIQCPVVPRFDGAVDGDAENRVDGLFNQLGQHQDLRSCPRKVRDINQGHHDAVAGTIGVAGGQSQQIAISVASDDLAFQRYFPFQHPPQFVAEIGVANQQCVFEDWLTQIAAGQSEQAGRTGGESADVQTMVQKDGVDFGGCQKSIDVEIGLRQFLDLPSQRLVLMDQRLVSVVDRFGFAAQSIAGPKQFGVFANQRRGAVRFGKSDADRGGADRFQHRFGYARNAGRGRPPAGVIMHAVGRTHRGVAIRIAFGCSGKTIVRRRRRVRRDQSPRFINV